MSPEESYRLAIGEKITSNTGQEVQLVRPLDWLAISDHAEGFGSFFEIMKGNPIMMEDPIAKRWHDLLKEGTKEANQELAVGIPAALASGNLPEPVTNPRKSRTHAAKQLAGIHGYCRKVTMTPENLRP